MEPIHLFGSYYFREASAEEFEPFFNAHRATVFIENIVLPLEDWTTDREKVMRSDLSALIRERFILRIIILKNDEIIGWHLGRQIDDEQFNMNNTGILKEHRNKGIYSSLLPKLLELIREKGFQKVVSKHHASNNAVIIPKLKAGFVIHGMEISERHGVFVLLAYIFNEDRLKAFQFRTGARRPDEELKKHL